MSESEEHRRLVQLMAEKLYRGGEICVSADRPDFPSVPSIDGYRPDVYGYHKTTKCEYICEAKTFEDLRTARSIKQISTFINHLELGIGNVLTIGGIGQTASRAKTILRFHAQNRAHLNCSLQVFDGLDFWTLDRENKRIWHLY